MYLSTLPQNIKNITISPIEIPVEGNYEDYYKDVPQVFQLSAIGLSGHIFGLNQLTSGHLLKTEMDLLNFILVLYPHFHCRVCRALVVIKSIFAVTTGILLETMELRMRHFLKSQD